MQNRRDLCGWVRFFVLDIESCTPKVLRRWVRTGDEVIIDKNHDIFIVDRLKVAISFHCSPSTLMVFFQEILKVRGFQVAPAELEGHLLSHPDVADTCVVGVPDDFSGEVPLAFVVLSADAVKRASVSEAAAAKIKASISKVCCSMHCDYTMTNIDA